MTIKLWDGTKFNIVPEATVQFRGCIVLLIFAQKNEIYLALNEKDAKQALDRMNNLLQPRSLKDEKQTSTTST